MSGLNTAGVTQLTAANFATGVVGSTPLLVSDYPQAAGQSPQQLAIPLANVDAVTPTAITYAATITPDRSLGSVHTCTLTGNVTLANPIGIMPGQRIEVVLTQDGTGSRLLSAVGSLWKFPGGTKTLTTTAGAVDCIKGIYDGTRILANLSLAYA